MPIRTRPHRRTLLAGIAAALTARNGRAKAVDGPMPVVASFSILADLARQVGGDRVLVTALVGPGQDAHAYEPSPADIASVSAARILLVNGLGLEGWIGRLARTAGGAATLVTASRDVRPIRVGGAADPHAFQDVGNAKLYVVAIRDAFAAADPAGASAYGERARTYADQLDRLDSEIRAGIGAIPAARRRIVTDHDAFGYYGAAYGLSFVAPRGVSTESEVSARDVARIIRQVREDRIPAVFLENVSDPRLVEQIARESGARIGGRVFSDALSGPDGPAATYLDLMRHNLRMFVAALAG